MVQTLDLAGFGMRFVFQFQDSSGRPELSFKESVNMTRPSKSHYLDEELERFNSCHLKRLTKYSQGVI